jgi:Bacteriophage tail sheath protein
VSTYKTPGIYREHVVVPPPAALETGVPAFLGYAEPGPGVQSVEAIRAWADYTSRYSPPGDAGVVTSYLAGAVEGFFGNGGLRCFVVLLDNALPAEEAVRRGLAGLDGNDEVDLICTPDVVRRPTATAALPLTADEADTMKLLQRLVLEHCDGRADRFTILDSLPRAGIDDVLDQRGSVRGTNGALYYPWIRTRSGGDDALAFMPPCGHVAGVFARTDAAVGAHKAPANAVLEGVLDLSVAVEGRDQERLNPYGVNCIRAFPGRGIRVWGARTLSAQPAWAYVNVRRIFLTAARWIDRALAHVVFEPADAALWDYVEREVGAYFIGLYRRGALRGATPDEAFYVKCDAETNPPEERDAGRVVTEIGLAAAIPNEFVVVQIVQHADGVTIAGPSRPG